MVASSLLKHLVQRGRGAHRVRYSYSCSGVHLLLLSTLSSILKSTTFRTFHCCPPISARPLPNLFQKHGNKPQDMLSERPSPWRYASILLGKTVAPLARQMPQKFLSPLDQVHIQSSALCCHRSRRTSLP